MIEEENESILTVSCQKSRLMISSKINLDGEFLPSVATRLSHQVRPDEQLLDEAEYPKPPQNFQKKTDAEQDSLLANEASGNKSFHLKNLGEGLSYRGSISDIKNLTDNLTINSGDLQKSSSNLNFFSSHKKEFSQIINHMFHANKCRWKSNRSESVSTGRSVFEQYCAVESESDRSVTGSSHSTQNESGAAVVAEGFGGSLAGQVEDARVRFS